MTRATSSNEELTHNQSEYTLFQEYASNPSMAIQNINCSAGSLYRDTYILVIQNFTSDKNGYYWCQIYVNNSISQPSQYAWFYAADRSSCTQQSNFKLTNEPQCAYVHSDTNQVLITMPQETSTVITTLTSVTVEATSTSETLEMTSKATSTSVTIEATSTSVTLEMTSKATSTSATVEATSTSATVEATSTSETVEATSTSVTLETTSKATSTSATVEVTSTSVTLETTPTSVTVETTSTSATIEATSTSVTLETTPTSATLETISRTQEETVTEFTSTGTTLKYNIVSATEAESSTDYLFYIIGFLVVLILLAISLFTLILLLLYCKGRKKDCQRSGKYATITILAAIVQSSN